MVGLGHRDYLFFYLGSLIKDRAFDQVFKRINPLREKYIKEQAITNHECALRDKLISHRLANFNFR